MRLQNLRAAVGNRLLSIAGTVVQVGVVAYIWRAARQEHVTTMFVRFRKTPNRLQVSVLEAHRVGGKVTNEHVASLGSIDLSMSVGSRQAFWAHLWDRLTSLSNRIGPDDQAKIRNAVHARIPMVMPEEARAEEARLWAEASELFREKGTREREQAAHAIEQAENHEGLAAIFAENRAAVLRGEHVEDNPRGLVLEILAAQLGLSGPAAAQYNPPDGTPMITANGEPGFYRTPKRPDRHDRRRRRWGVRYTPKAVKGWKPGFGSRKATPDEIAEMIAAAEARRAAEESDDWREARPRSSGRSPPEPAPTSHTERNRTR